jgi:hypothetical protein
MTVKSKVRGEIAMPDTSLISRAPDYAQRK